jgi:hypothetical protein
VARFSGGGGTVAQIKDSAPKETVCYRAPVAQRDALEKIASDERTKLSKVCAFVMDLGIELYLARNELGEALDSFADGEGLSRRAALLEVLKRGLAKKR